MRTERDPLQRELESLPSEGGPTAPSEGGHPEVEIVREVTRVIGTSHMMMMKKLMTRC